MAGNDPQWQIWLKKWLRLGQNGHFCIFFYVFPQNEAEIDLEWSISPDSQLFPSFATKASHFWRNLKNFHFWGGGVHQQFFWNFPTFTNRFTQMQLEMTHNGKSGQKSGLDWVKMAIFAYFSIFSPKMRLRLTRNGQFHLIHNFSHLLPPKHLIFGEISKISISGEGGTSANVLRFPTFSNRFTPMWLEMTYNGKFGPKSGLDWVKMAIFAYFSIFSPKMRLRLTRNGQFHLIHNFSHLLLPKHLIFGEISKIFISRGGYIGNFFWNFSTFSNRFTPMQLEMTHNGKFSQKRGLDWVKMAIFAYFSIFSPKMRLRLTWNGQFHLIHNFSHLLPPKHLIFGEISKIFNFWGGVHRQFFWNFPTFSNRFTPMQLEMTHNGKFGQKSGLDWVKMAIFAYFSIFSPKMRLRLTQNGQFHLIHNFSHLLPPKRLIFLEKSQKFSFLGGVHRQMF